MCVCLKNMQTSCRKLLNYFAASHRIEMSQKRDSVFFNMCSNFARRSKTFLNLSITHEQTISYIIKLYTVRITRSEPHFWIHCRAPRRHPCFSMPRECWSRGASRPKRQVLKVARRIATKNARWSRGASRPKTPFFFRVRDATRIV